MKKDSIKYISNGIDDIILINPRQSSEQNEDGNLIINQCYGMDSLFNKIYEIFKSQKIYINEIESLKNVNEMMNYIKNYKLLRKIYSKIYINIKLKIYASKVILSSSSKNGFFDRLIRKGEKEMLNKITVIYNADNKDIDNTICNIKKQINNMDKIDKKSLIEHFFNSLKSLENIFIINGFSLDPYYYDEHIVLIGVIYLKNFEKEFRVYNEETKKYLKEYSSSLNEAIDGFNLIAKEWTAYSDLKLHKTQRECAKNFIL